MTSVTISERENGKPKTAVITIQSIGKIMKEEEEHRLFYVFIKDITDSITSVQKEKLLNSNQFYQERE